MGFFSAGGTGVMVNLDLVADLLNTAYGLSHITVRKKLVRRWRKCIAKQGDCVEKLCYYKFYSFIEIKFVSVVRIIIDSTTCIHVVNVYFCTCM